MLQLWSEGVIESGCAFDHWTDGRMYMYPSFSWKKTVDLHTFGPARPQLEISNFPLPVHDIRCPSVTLSTPAVRREALLTYSGATGGGEEVVDLVLQPCRQAFKSRDHGLCYLELTGFLMEGKRNLW